MHVFYFMQSCFFNEGIEQFIDDVLSCSGVSDSVPLWSEAHQAPLSMVILLARILEKVAMPSFRGSSQLRDGTQVRKPF